MTQDIRYGVGRWLWYPQTDSKPFLNKILLYPPWRGIPVIVMKYIAFLMMHGNPARESKSASGIYVSWWSEIEFVRDVFDIVFWINYLPCYMTLTSAEEVPDALPTSASINVVRSIWTVTGRTVGSQPEVRVRENRLWLLLSRNRNIAVRTMIK